MLRYYDVSQVMEASEKQKWANYPFVFRLDRSSFDRTADVEDFRDEVHAWCTERWPDGDWIRFGILHRPFSPKTWLMLRTGVGFINESNAMEFKMRWC